MTTTDLHPLRNKRKPGPVGEDDETPAEGVLGLAQTVLDLVDKGVLPKTRPTPLPIAVDRRGRPLRKILTADEEIQLSQRVQANGDIDARNALVLANMGLVVTVANQWKPSGIVFEDLIQEGVQGLIRATETFNPRMGNRFSTYGMYWVRAKIQRFAQRYERDDKPAIMTADMETLATGRRRRPRSSVIPMDVPLGTGSDGDDRTFGDTLASEEPSQAEILMSEQRQRRVREALAEVVVELGDPRLSLIVEHRILTEDPMTLSDVGLKLGLSREGVRLLESKIMKRAAERLSGLRETPGPVVKWWARARPV